MKKILITGANSYIGTSFARYMAQWPLDYQVDTIDMIDGSWRDKSFAGYDSVFHVAGIAHQDSGKITEQRKQLYNRVNTDLAIETAKKAKADGVHQFIYMSSIVVYGVSAKLGQIKVITKDTVPSPEGAYGMSKLKAEQGILPLHDDSFYVCVLRPPMIYGPGCKGNYRLLAKTAKLIPFFPYVANQRSMLYIRNLLEFVRLVVINKNSGIFLPQNNVYSNTSLMVKEIAAAHDKHMILVNGFGWLIKLASPFVTAIPKVFGSLIIDQSLSEFTQPYSMVSHIESIHETEIDPGTNTG